MTTKPLDSLRQQVERLIIENRNFLNDPTTNEPYDVKGIADDVVSLIQQTNIEARIDELEYLNDSIINNAVVMMRLEQLKQENKQ